MSTLEAYTNITKFPVNKKLTKREKRQLQQIEKLNLELSYIVPKTDNQCKVFDYFDDGFNLSLLGYPGTGKSFISLYLALSLIKDTSDYSSVTIIRSVVPSRDIGFLPGSEADKARVYEAPYEAICNELYGRGDAYEVLKRHGIIRFETTSFLRSVTMNDTIILVDECQNMNQGELHTVITRVGENSKIIFAGDFGQNDLAFKKGENSGLGNFQNILDHMKSFRTVYFDSKDVVRSGLVKDYILTKARLEQNK